MADTKEDLVSALNGVLGFTALLAAGWLLDSRRKPGQAAATPPPGLGPIPALPDIPVTAATTAADLPVTEVHRVELGESLSRIADKAYGRPDYWPAIYDANRAGIGENPDYIAVEMSLRIPDLSNAPKGVLQTYMNRAALHGAAWTSAMQRDQNSTPDFPPPVTSLTSWTS